MCSIFNSDDLDTNINNKISTGVKDTCKCGSTEIVLTLTLYGSFCRECFLQRVSHKFRSEFGKSRLIRDNEDVVVAFSGGKKSTAMVNLIKEGRSKRAQKKLRFNPTLIYVLEPKQFESSCSFDDEIVETLSNLEMPFYIFSLSQVFEEDLIPLLSNKDDIKTFNKDKFCDRINFSKLYDLKKSLKQPTSIESMLIMLRKQLFTRICKELNLTKVLMGDTVSQLAVRLISFVSQGRGGQLAYEMEFADERNVEAIFVKPMRAFLDEEIDMLLELKELQFIKDPTQKYEVQTIEKLSNEFIKKLQTENDKTMSIICRTGEKLTVTNRQPNATDDVCLLCQARIDKNASKVTANSAVKISSGIADKLRSDVNKRAQHNDVDVVINSVDFPSVGCCQNENKISDAGNRHGSCDSLGGCCRNERNEELRITKDDVVELLCYGCQILVRDMKDIEKLPKRLIADVQMKIKRKKMKESIEDFIIEDEDSHP